MLNGRRRVGIPWQTIGAFCRIVSHPRVITDPLTGDAAWEHIAAWLETDPTWIPPATERTAAVHGEIVGRQQVTGDLVPDAMLAGLALEHGLTVMTADTDFARFPVRWSNPLPA